MYTEQASELTTVPKEIALTDFFPTKHICVNARARVCVIEKQDTKLISMVYHIYKCSIINVWLY